MLATSETLHIKSVPLEREEGEQALQDDTYQESMLRFLGLINLKDEIDSNPTARHRATRRAVMHLGKTINIGRNHARFMPDGYFVPHYYRARDIAQHFITTEVNHADATHAPDVKFLDETMDVFMGLDPSHPTYISVTEQAVDLLEDDHLAAGYLGRMLSGTSVIDRWMPVVDRTTRDYLYKGKIVNEDIQTMQGWKDRFVNYPSLVGQLDNLFLEAGVAVERLPVE